MSKWGTRGRWGIYGSSTPVNPNPGWGNINPFGNGQIVTRAGAPMDVDSPDQSWSVQVANGVDRFELRPGDRWAGDGAAATKERVEFNTANTNYLQPFDTDVWLSVSFRVSGAFLDAPWMVIGQMRAYDDPGEWGGRSPVFAQELLPGNGFRVVTRSYPEQLSTSATSTAATVRYQDNNFTLNQWHSVVYKMRFARTGNGLLAGWVDGATSIPEVAIPMGGNDTYGPGLKYGLYRDGGGTQTTVVEYANLELGTVSLFSRVASPLPLPT